MLSRLFRFLHGIPCDLLGMNEVAWQETRETMHVNVGQEALGKLEWGLSQLKQ